MHIYHTQIKLDTEKRRRDKVGATQELIKCIYIYIKQGTSHTDDSTVEKQRNLEEKHRETETDRVHFVTFSRYCRRLESKL